MEKSITRQNVLAWMKLASQAKESPQEPLFCPNDKEQLQVTVNEFAEYGKKEVTLKCQKCGTERTVTFDL